MDRRTFGTSMLAGALGIAAAPVLAQPRRLPPSNATEMGPAEQRHVMDTLMIGAVALETSRMALGRANRP